MKQDHYAHKITCYEDLGKRYIRIDRILPDGSITKVNNYELPECTSENKWDLLENIMAVIGKTVAIDNPCIRTHFKLVDDQLFYSDRTQIPSKSRIKFAAF
jgi:hypothetical protein